MQNGMWNEITWHFRDSMEGSVFVLATIVFVLLLSPAIYKLSKDRWEEKRKAMNIVGHLKNCKLSSAEKKLVIRAIQELSPGNPESVVQDPRLFNRWVDSLPEIDSPSPQLVEQLANIREELFNGVFVVPPLRSTRDFQPNLFVNICQSEGADVLLPSVLVELDDGQIIFRLSRRDTEFNYSPGTEVLLHVPHPEAMYIARVNVKSLSADKRQIMVTHAGSGKFQVRQYREFWRVDLSMGVHFQLIDKEGTALTGLDSQFDGTLINLSGGGAAMVSEQKVVRNHYIKFPLYLVDRVLNPVIARVIDSDVLANGKCRSHMMFVGVAPDERDQIIRSLFQWQRERLQTQTREGV